MKPLDPLKPPLRWIPLLALAILMAAGVWEWLGARRVPTLAQSRRPVAPSDAVRGGDSELEATGTVEGTLVRIAAKLPGRVAAVRVQEGDRVRAGQELVALEERDLRAERDQARARLGAASARYEEARAGTRSEEIEQAGAELARARAARDGAAAAVRNLETQLARSTELKQSLDAAQSQLAAAQAALAADVARLERLKAGTRPDELREAEQAVAGAEATAQRAVEEEERMHRAYDRGAVARREWDLARTERDVTAANLARVRAHLADLRAGARPEELREAEQQVAAARAAEEGARAAVINTRRLYQDRLPARQRLDAARADLHASAAAAAGARARLDLLRRGTRPEVLRQISSQLREARAAVELAESHWRDRRIVSPAAGVVTQRAVEPGEVVQAGVRLLEIADLRSVWVRVYLPEKEYGRVRVGQRAAVTTDSPPGQSFAGRVAAIAQEAEYTPRNIQTKEERVNLMYGVKVEIANPHGALHIGMPADVRFF